ncbi:hypothetical protein [Sulfurimonas sp.]
MFQEPKFFIKPLFKKLSRKSGNITPTKLARLIKTAQVYMKKNALDMAFTLDAVIVTPQGIEMLENITL